MPTAPDPWLLPPALRAALVRDLPHRPAVYWADLLIAAGLGWGLFALSMAAPLSAGWALATVGSALAFLRAAMFLHELTHLPKERVPGFHLAWNLLVGIPVLVPSLMMWTHRDHHALATYGTAQDPEYAPVPTWGRGRLLGTLGLYLVVPWLMAVRWGFTAPLSFLHPRLRRHALERFSTADIDARYVRPPLRPDERRAFLAEEFACTAVTWAALGAATAGWLPWWIFVQRAIVMAIALVVNHARILVVHGYAGDGAPMSGRAQVLDSVTLGPDSWATEIVAPIGSRFHALHHELPGLPYHALPEAHRRVLAALEPDHPYLGTIRAGFVAAWADRWRAARRPQPAPSAG